MSEIKVLSGLNIAIKGVDSVADGRMGLKLKAMRGMFAAWEWLAGM